MDAHIVKCSNLKILFLIFLLLFSYINFCVSQYHLQGEDVTSSSHLLKTAADIIKDTYRRIDTLEYIKQDNINSVQYEVGYLTFTINDKYRKMIDKYNTTKTMGPQLFQMELVMYLEEIELHFWEIDHLANMLHEVERKYRINTSIHSTFHEFTSREVNAVRLKKQQEILATAPHLGPLMYKPKTKKFVLSKYLKDKLSNLYSSTTTKSRKRRWPIDYGWEPDFMQ